MTTKFYFKHNISFKFRLIEIITQVINKNNNKFCYIAGIDPNSGLQLIPKLRVSVCVTFHAVARSFRGIWEMTCCGSQF